jgi:hypothetical protein
MPHAHVPSISTTVRRLHIAFAVALLAGACAPCGHAADQCDGVEDGTLCPDDLDPCSDDACTAGVCTHVAVPDRGTCDPVIDAYRRTLGLGDLVQELAALFDAAAVPETTRPFVDAALDGTAADLARESETLAGRVTIPPPLAGETLAQSRARAAFGVARATPPRVRDLLRAIRPSTVRVAVGPGIVDLARRARFLYRSTNKLKRELRRLQRVSGVFTR